MEEERKKKAEEEKAKKTRTQVITTTHVDEATLAPFAFFDKPTGHGGQQVDSNPFSFVLGVSPVSCQIIAETPVVQPVSFPMTIPL